MEREKGKDDVSNVSSEGPIQAMLLGAARHREHLSKEVHVCAGSQRVLEKKRKSVFQRALDSKPLALQSKNCSGPTM